MKRRPLGSTGQPKDDLDMSDLARQEESREQETSPYGEVSCIPILAFLSVLHARLGDVNFKFIPRQGVGVVLADSLVCTFL